MVLTTPANFHLKAVHVAATWGRRCGKLVFLSDHVSGHVSRDPGQSWEVLEIRGAVGREKLWDKVRFYCQAPGPGPGLQYLKHQIADKGSFF